MGTLVFQATLGGAVNIIGPNIASTINFTLPSADGTSGQTWTTNGSGVLAFGTLGIAGGGTGQITATAAFNALAPSQSGQSGKYLTTDGTNTSWGTNPLGTVTSVGGTGTVNGITLTGTVTTSGNLTLGGTLSGVSLTTQVTGILPTANGGTNLGGATPFTSGGVVYASSTSALATGSALTFDGTSFGVGTASPSTYGKLAVNGSLGILNGAPAYFYNSGNTSYASIACVDTNSIAFTNGATEGLRLTSTSLYTASGINVGIGLSNPAYKLDVVTTGNTLASNIASRNTTSGTGAGAQILVGNDSSPDLLVIRALSSTYTSSGVNTADGALIRAGAAGGLTLAATDASGTIKFAAGGTTQRMVLDSAGNLGLGVTPSAWGSVYKAMQLNTSGAITSDTSAKVNISSNGYAYAQDAWAYLANNNATLYQQASGQHRWFNAPSGFGAGQAITFTQAMTLDASGNLGIGATSPQQNLDIRGSTTVGTKIFGVGTNANAVTLLVNSAGNQSGSYNADTASVQGVLCIGAYTSGATATSLVARGSAIIAETTGNLLVGTTTNPSYGKIVVDGGTVEGINFVNTSGATRYAAVFINGSTTVGSITTSTTLTTYNVTSDYRLKTVIGAVTGHGERLDALEPIEYEWKSNGSRSRGFLAHKFQEVYADSVTGEKDAVDANGNPKHQSMQAGSSEVIADLVAEIQSLRQRLSAANL